MQTTAKHRNRISKTILALGSFIAVLLGITCPSFQWRASAQDPMDDDMDMRPFVRPIGMAGALVDDGFVPNQSTDPTYTTLDYPDALLTVAFGINNSGNIVGFYQDADFDFHGFLYDRVTRSFASRFTGSFTSIDYTNPVCTTGTDARGINERGDIVGTCTDAAGNFYGYLLTGDGFTSIQAPGHLSTIPQRISSDGDNIVGCIHDTNMSTTMFGMWRDAAGFNLFGGMFGGLTGTGFMHNGISRGGGNVVGLFMDTTVNRARLYPAR